MRKLATIRKIDAIRPIAGADAIECAVVGGWTVVVKKGEFAPGDLAVYCEIDSWIPTALAPFLSKGQAPREFDGIAGERLRTVKLRGQLSQGLLLPFTAKMAIDIGAGPGAKFTDYEGTDVSELLGIVKWEAPVPAQLAGEVRGAFPGFMPKTDQERIQNLSEEFKTWGDLHWEVTEKLDGSSMTVYAYDGDSGVCSRNLNLRDTESNTLWRVAHRDQILTAILDSGRDLAIQGELIGEGIQGNPYRLRGQSFYVFDIYDIRAGHYLRPLERQEFCENFELLHVPIIACTANLQDTLGIVTIDHALKFAEGKSKLHDKAEREGLVFKCIELELSFKAISNRFLLKGGN